MALLGSANKDKAKPANANLPEQCASFAPRYWAWFNADFAKSGGYYNANVYNGDCTLRYEQAMKFAKNGPKYKAAEDALERINREIRVAYGPSATPAAANPPEIPFSVPSSSRDVTSLLSPFARLVSDSPTTDGEDNLGLLLLAGATLLWLTRKSL